MQRRTDDEDMSNDPRSGQGQAPGQAQAQGTPGYHAPAAMPTSPIRFATSTNAFGLAASPASSSSSGNREAGSGQLNVETSPLSGVKPRLRRPSMLSLAQTASFSVEPQGGSDEDDMEDDSRPPSRRAVSRLKERNPFDVSHPSPRWSGPSSGPGFLGSRGRNDSGSLLDLNNLSTTTPPIPTSDLINDNLATLDRERSPPRWLPGHLQRRKGKMRGGADGGGEADGLPPDAHRPPFGPALPVSLLDTLKSESSPLEHEYKSEARLQRLISSHPRAVPFTPRTARSSRGRFPETAGDEDDEDDYPSRRALWASRAWTRRSSSDSDSDDMMPIDDGKPGGNERERDSVNAAFAAGMDMERMASASEAEGSGKSTPGARSGSGSGSVPPGSTAAGVTTPAGANGGYDRARPPRMSFSGGLVASPGTGFGLPSAFGGLGMGTGTPIGSPTIERLDVSLSTLPSTFLAYQGMTLQGSGADEQLATSPNAMSLSITNSPSLMQYRESTGGSASIRPGKRKAGMTMGLDDRYVGYDRFDPYKRPRGSSPALSTSSMGMGFGSSPSRPSYIPIPNSANIGSGAGGGFGFGGGGSGGGANGSGTNGGIGSNGQQASGQGGGGVGQQPGPGSPMPTYNPHTPLLSAIPNPNFSLGPAVGVGGGSSGSGGGGGGGGGSGGTPGSASASNVNIAMANLRQGPGRSGHPYTRPLSSRSRGASPALSVGAGGGGGGGAGAGNGGGSGLGTSVGSTRGFTLGGAFQQAPSGAGQQQQQQQQHQHSGAGMGAGTTFGSAQQQQQQGGLGSLGLLSLGNTTHGANAGSGQYGGVSSQRQGQSQARGQSHTQTHGRIDEEGSAEGDDTDRFAMSAGLEERRDSGGMDED